MKFLTEEWGKDFEALMKDTFSPGKTPSKLTLSLCECYNAVPQCGGGTVWYLYILKDGVLTDIKRGEGRESAPAADYTSDCDYEPFVQTMTGELNTVKALTSGKIKFKGSLLKALKMLDTHNVITECKRLGGRTEW